MWAGGRGGGEGDAIAEVVGGDGNLCGMSARPLSEFEYNKMVEFLATAGRHRDRLLLVLGCATGYRITELLSLKWEQLWDGTAARSEVQVARRNLKGGQGQRCRSVRSRRVPLNERAPGRRVPEAASCCRAWMKERAPPAASSLIPVRAVAPGAEVRRRSGGAGREWREESATVDARQGRRCRVLSLRRRDPGEWSGLDDESPEAAVSAGAKPSPTAMTGQRQNGAAARERRVQPLAVE